VSVKRSAWWVFVLVAAGVNVVRQLVFPPSEVGTFWTVTLFVLVLAFSGLVVSAGLRLARRR
jgi:hypothetical protein